MRWVIMALLLLGGCVAQNGQIDDATNAPSGGEMQDDAMGGAPTAQPNIPGGTGALAVRTQEVRYFGDVAGFEARPEGDGAYPGVVMIHEWWGLNDNIRAMAEQLASHGYHVLAVDLYEGAVATTSDEARALVSGFDAERGTENLQAAADYLREHANGQVASLGWCFGGGQSLTLARAEELDAAVIYYGSLVTDEAELASVDEPVLGIFAENDQSIPVSDVEAFSAVLDRRGVQNEVVVYPGVQHAFANPSGERYDAQAAQDAWTRTLAFLEANLQGSAEEPQEDRPDVTFQLTGQNFRFSMDGEENPTLRVKEGDRVRIEFTSAQGFHDWVVDEFDAATEQVMAGDATFVEFVADRKGTFEYYCSVGSHRANGMRGSLVVE